MTYLPEIYYCIDTYHRFYRKKISIICFTEMDLKTHLFLKRRGPHKTKYKVNPCSVWGSLRLLWLSLVLRYPTSDDLARCIPVGVK